MGQDVKLVKTKIDGVEEEILVVHLKSPKEEKLSQGVKVELFANGTFSCPVKAWKSWRALLKGSACPTKPVFRYPNGLCFTGASFNKNLKSLLGKYFNYDEGRYLSHSFRAGVASAMAQAGYSDEIIMRQGRWRSSAFLVYCKTGRASRLREQRELAGALANMTN